MSRMGRIHYCRCCLPLSICPQITPKPTMVCNRWYACSCVNVANRKRRPVPALSLVDCRPCFSFWWSAPGWPNSRSAVQVGWVRCVIPTSDQYALYSTRHRSRVGGRRRRRRCSGLAGRPDSKAVRKYCCCWRNRSRRHRNHPCRRFRRRTARGSVCER